MSTLQSAHQYGKDSWPLEIREKGGGIQNERTQRRKAKRIEYKKTCNHCGSEYTCGSRNQKYCSSTCYGKQASIRKANPYNDIECISCLAHLGFGCKAISRKFYKTKHATIRHIIKRRGLPASSSKRSANRHVDSCIKNHLTIQKQKRQEMIKRCDKMLRVISGLKKKCRVINKAARNYGPGFDWQEMSWGGVYYWANICFERNRSRQNAKKREIIKGSHNHIKKICGNMIWRAIKLGYVKKSKTMHYFGCTTEQLKLHLQSKFSRNMNWNNYGSLWEVDHIIPCDSFDLTDDYQVRLCNHFTNLQPMLKSLNRRKSNKFIQPAFQLQFL